MGDAFIHFVFARGIAEGQAFTYNGEFSAGSTSPLWSILLAPLWKIFGMKIIWVVKIFAGFFTTLAVLLTFAVAQKISRNRALALVASALVAGSYVFSYWSAKGMETSLYVCLVLISFLFYLKLLELPLKWGTLKKNVFLELLFGILLGLTILTRPEAWLLAAFLGVPLIIRRGWHVLVSIGIPALLVLSPYYLTLLEETGQLLPSSAARILRAQQWALEFGGIHFTLEILKVSLTKLLPLTPFFIFLLWKKPQLDRFIFFPVLAWLAFHVFFFTFIFPTTEGYRYLLAALPFFCLIALMGVWQLNPQKLRTIALTFILVGSFSISGQQLAERIQSITHCEVPFIDNVRRETGLWLKENTEPNDLIALKEVDQSAFYSERKVLSMDGTLDSKAIPFVRSGDHLGLIVQERPDYFVLEEEMYREYPDWQDSELTILADPSLGSGDSKTLADISFDFVHKIKSGDPESCSHYSGEYFWYIFKLRYP